VDQKEGCYFGREAKSEDARWLHGGNLWPTAEGFAPEGAPFPEAEAWQAAVHEYMAQVDCAPTWGGEGKGGGGADRKENK
jgi:hypothetical protein